MKITSATPERYVENPRHIADQHEVIRTLSEQRELAQAIELGREVWTQATEEKRPLSEEEAENFQTGLNAWNTLLLANVRLVIHSTKGYWSRRQAHEQDDIIQAGILGLEHAIEKYDWRFGVKFSTYATSWIKQSAQKHINRTGYSLHIPEQMISSISSLYKYENSDLTDEDVLQESGWTTEQLREIRRSRSLQHAYSLDAPLPGMDVTLHEQVQDEAASEFEERYLEASVLLERAMKVVKTVLPSEDYGVYESILAQIADQDTPEADEDEETIKSASQMGRIRGLAAAAIKHPSSSLAPLYDEQEFAWQKEAECRGVPVEAFFPTRGKSLERALAYCGACAVRSTCTDYAIRSSIRHGIWGGTSERQRRVIRKQNTRSSAE